MLHNEKQADIKQQEEERKAKELKLHKVSIHHNILPLGIRLIRQVNFSIQGCSKGGMLTMF